MRFEEFAFGRIRIDRMVYDHNLVIDHRRIRKRKKGGEGAHGRPRE